MTTITSLSLRIFPGRATTTWALTWRVQRASSFNDRRLQWGTLPVGREYLRTRSMEDLLRAVADQMGGRTPGAAPGEAGREPLGAVGGGPPPGQGLPGIDPDE